MNFLSNAIVLKDNSYIKQQILDFEEKSVIRIPPGDRACSGRSNPHKWQL